MHYRLLAVLAALLIFPATASADGVVSLAVNGPDFTDSSDDANTLVVSRSDTAITFDDVEPMTIDIPAQGSCVNDDPTQVTCTFTAEQAPTRLIQISAGNGHDTVTVTADNDTDIEGGAGGDTLTGGPGVDTINGGPSLSEADVIKGGAGADTLDGNEGNDDIAGGSGGDAMQDSGNDSGIDTLRYAGDGEARPGGVEVTVDDGTANDGEKTGEGDEVGAGFDNFFLSEGGDEITGSGDAEELFGAAGDDILHGEGGDDVFGDSAGADTFDGGEDAGDADVDTVRFARVPDAGGVKVTIDNVANDGPNGGAEQDDVQDTIEHVMGTEGADDLTGSAGAETLDGQNGDDRIEGLGGADTLIGYFGTDVILARDGAGDTVHCATTFSDSDGWPNSDVVQVDVGGSDTLSCSLGDGDITDDKPAPEISNLSAENGIDQNDVPITILYGFIDANASDITEWYFEYGPTTAYGSETTPTGAGGDQPIEVNQSFMPQVPLGQTIHYRLVAFRGGKDKLVWRSADHTFTSTATSTQGDPDVVTGDATDVTSGGARLAGSVDPNGAGTGYKFVYGTNPNELDGATAEQDAGSGNDPVGVSATISGLKAGTKYYYRLLGVRPGDVFTPGDEKTFTTPAAGSQPKPEAPKPDAPKPPAPPAPGMNVIAGNFIVTGPAESTVQRIPTPDFRPKKEGKRWTLTSLDDARAIISGLGLNVDLTVKRVGDAGLPKDLADDDSLERVLDANEVVGQSPTPDKAPSIVNAVKGSKLPAFRITVYDPSLDRRLDRALDAKGCAYERRDSTGAQLRETLVNLPLHSADGKGAADRLAAQNCTWELATVKGDIRATETTVNRAVASRVRRSGLDGRQEIVSLHVTEPKPEPPVFTQAPNPNANNGAEIGIALSAGSSGKQMTFTQGKDDYELVLAGERQSFRVTPYQRASGHIEPPGTVVDVFFAADGEAGSGTLLESKTTKLGVGVQFDDVKVTRKGKLIIKATYAGRPKDGTANTVEGKREVRVVEKGCTEWLSINGVRFVPGRVATGCHNYNPAATARAADAFDFFGPLAGVLRKIFTGSEKAAETGKTQAGQPAVTRFDPSALKPCSADTPQQNAGQTPPLGLAKAVVVTPNGDQAAGQMPAVATSHGDACAINSSGILFDSSQMTDQLPADATVVQQTGGLLTAIQTYAKVQSVISTGGGNVISTGGGNARAGAEKVAQVISTGGGNITADQVLALVLKPDGTPRSGLEVAQVISTGGGNVISTGGGNLISDKGLGVISTGGGNMVVGARNVAGVIATGGGNFSLDQAAQVISTGGGNLRPDALPGFSAGVISTGGGNFKVDDVVSKVISTGGGNFTEAALRSYFTAASLIGQAGGNFVADPDRVMTVIADSVISTGGGNVISTGGGNLIGQAGGN